MCKAKTIAKLKEKKKQKYRTLLFPLNVFKELIKVYEYGANKYEVDDWKTHVEKTPEDFINAFYRHIHSHLEGELRDKESGLPHLAHAITNLCNLLWLALKKEKKKK